MAVSARIRAPSLLRPTILAASCSGARTRWFGPARALDEFHADGALQRNQRAIEGLQRSLKTARGGRLAALVDNRQKGFEIVQTFHVDIPPFGMLYHKILQLRGIGARLAAT